MTAGITTQAEPMTATDIKRSDMIAKINALGEGDVAVLITRSKANTGILQQFTVIDDETASGTGTATLTLSSAYTGSSLTGATVKVAIRPPVIA